MRRLENPLSTMFGFMGSQTRKGNVIFKRWQVTHGRRMRPDIQEKAYEYLEILCWPLVGGPGTGTVGEKGILFNRPCSTSFYLATNV